MDLNYWYDACPRCHHKKRAVAKLCMSCYRGGRKSKSREAKKRTGECLQCRAKATVGYYCLDDWFANTACNHFGTRKASHLLREAWDRQKGRCVYTGERLIPGKTAGLDHRVPKSRGGGDSPENIQWVSQLVNRVKTDLTHTEFLALCKKIATRFS